MNKRVKKSVAVQIHEAVYVFTMNAASAVIVCSSLAWKSIDQQWIQGLILIMKISQKYTSPPPLSAH